MSVSPTPFVGATVSPIPSGSPTPLVNVIGTHPPTPSPLPSVLGDQIAPPLDKSDSDFAEVLNEKRRAGLLLGATLPFTGSNLIPFVVVAVLIIGAGIAILTLRRRKVVTTK